MFTEIERVTIKNISRLDLSSLKGYKPKSFNELEKFNELKKSFTDEGINSRFKEIKNINNISFGHFVLIEKILSFKHKDVNAKIEMIAPILIRPVGEEKLNNSDKEAEGKHKELVYDIGIGTIYAAFNRFMDVRKNYLYKTYNGVIYNTLEDIEDDEEAEGTNVNSSQSAREFHTEKFFWNTLIDQVAGGDLFKHADAVELMMYVVMPFLAEKRSLNIVETLEAKARR